MEFKNGGSSSSSSDSKTMSSSSSSSYTLSSSSSSDSENPSSDSENPSYDTICPCSDKKCEKSWKIIIKYGVSENDIILYSFFVKNLTIQFFNMLIPIELTHYIFQLLLKCYISEKYINKKKTCKRRLFVLECKTKIKYYCTIHCSYCHANFFRRDHFSAVSYCISCRMDFCSGCSNKMKQNPGTYDEEYACEKCYNKKCVICGNKIRGSGQKCYGCKKICCSNQFVCINLIKGAWYCILCKQR